MADAEYHRYYRGILLPKIAYYLSGGRGDQKKIVDILHRAFKEYFCIGTTASLSNHHFLVYMSAILMWMAREKGILIPFFNESDDINEMTMTEWLKLQRSIEKN